MGMLMKTKAACDGNTKTCQWSSCRRGVCALKGFRLPVPSKCKGCGNLSYTVTCRVCTKIDEEVKA